MDIVDLAEKGSASILACLTSANPASMLEAHRRLIEGSLRHADYEAERV